ncbi:MAG: NAD(P)-binding domain-containing protein [Acidocella sp.]|nr:NAD(P)-binding domain-containing protein [Acidocella sp.]
MEDVVIIGAGPYGLSAAAHLAAAGRRVRVFGTPMKTWADHMPDDMHLKSEGFASDLYDPRGEFPLAAYCAENHIAYADIGLPVSRRVFTDYGVEFARRYVPMMQKTDVAAVRPATQGFNVELQSGERLKTRHVVSAVGITHYAHIASAFAGLPPHLVSHSSARADLSGFAGKSVAVVGSGASAVDCASALSKLGADTHLLSRRAAVNFHSPPRQRTLVERARAPWTTIGPGWKSVLCTQAPLLFHAMPERFRVEITRRYLGPVGSWFVHEQIKKAVHVHVNALIKSATPSQSGVAIMFEDETRPPLLVDHVIAATGYRVNLARLGFLDPTLVPRIKLAAGAPALSRSFESSVPGLFFVGPSAANAFGPMMRFACGAKFASRRLVQRL